MAVFKADRSLSMGPGVASDGPTARKLDGRHPSTTMGSADPARGVGVAVEASPLGVKSEITLIDETELINETQISQARVTRGGPPFPQTRATSK